MLEVEKKYKKKKSSQVWGSKLRWNDEGMGDGVAKALEGEGHRHIWTFIHCEIWKTELKESLQRGIVVKSGRKGEFEIQEQKQKNGRVEE